MMKEHPMTREEQDFLLDDMYSDDATTFEETQKLQDHIEKVQMDSISHEFDTMSGLFVSMEQRVQGILTLINANHLVFETLITKFPNVKQFQTVFKDNLSIKQSLESLSNDIHTAEHESIKVVEVFNNQIKDKEAVNDAMDALQKAYKAIETLGKK